MWIMPNFADFKSQERRNPLHISKFLMMHRPAKPRFPSSNLGGTSRVKAPKSLYIKAFGVFLLSERNFAAVKQNSKLAPKLPNFCRIYRFLSLCTGLYRTKVLKHTYTPAIVFLFYTIFMHTSSFFLLLSLLLTHFLRSHIFDEFVNFDELLSEYFRSFGM